MNLTNHHSYIEHISIIGEQLLPELSEGEWVKGWEGRRVGGKNPAKKQYAIF